MRIWKPGLRVQTDKPVQAPVPSRELVDLTLFSTSVFVLAALFTQFLLTFYTSFLLRSFDINFHFSLFAVRYFSESGNISIPGSYTSGTGSKWSEDLIYFIFISGPVLLSSLGLLLMFILKKTRKFGWKTRLSLTWLAFIMTNALPCGIIAGVFFYDGFGVAFQWFIDGYAARGMFALVVFMILIIFSRFWQWMFLRAAYTSVFLDHIDYQKIFIKNAFVKPWVYGFLILLLFNWPFSNFFWRTCLLSLGFMALTLFDRGTSLHIVPSIRKPGKNISSARYNALFIAIVITLIWVADNYLLRS